MKYATEMATFENCPPEEAEESERTCYRFGKQPLNGDSFLPHALLPIPLRKPCCKAWALSMFASEEQARARIAHLERTNPGIRNRVGDKLARVSLTPAHGRQTEPNNSGHISLYEYARADLPKASCIVGKL